ncbi:MAG: 6-carboxytetrahydropterin synthase QueD [Dehalococcoidales bacterium]|nr:6-carboxytetrahydropterin synthase QueD [Dehalococcoidales bacterium]
MYEIAVERHFDAAHFLRGYQGKCEALHGHRFKVVAKIRATALDDIGLAFDFTELKRLLDTILVKYDHTCVNDVPPFDELNPSSENMAANIYEALQLKLAGAPVSLASIEVWESPQTAVTYTPDRV